ncbi:MAG: hypothetical protein ACE5KM_09880 [Planctomycetaceae bacterium]
MQWLISLFAPATSPWLTGFALYVLSYSPFLAIDAPRSNALASYRAPRFYRPVEWVILHTPLQRPLLKWAKFVGADGPTEVQVFFIAQGSEDPAKDFHFQFAPEEDEKRPRR